MKFNAAVAALVASGGFWMHLKGWSRTSAALAAIGTFIGMATLADLALGGGLGTGEMLLLDWTSASAGMGGLMPVAGAIFVTTLSLLVGAVALVPASVLRNTIVQVVSLIAMAVAFEVLAGAVAQSGGTITSDFPGRLSLPGTICALALATGIFIDSWRSQGPTVVDRSVWVALLYCIALATLDRYTPLELNIGICYIPLVYLAVRAERPAVIIDLAALATAMILLGILVSPRGEVNVSIVLINRALALVAVWFIAFLVHKLLVERNRYRRAQIHLAAAQTLAKCGSFEVDLVTMTLRGSRAFDAMHGRPDRGEEPWVRFVERTVAPDDRQVLAEVVASARRGIATHRLDYSFVSAAGTARNAALQTQLLRGDGGGDGGSVTGVIGVVQDVTEQRAADAHHAEIEMQLRHSQKLESLGVLVGSLSHDLNNTLLPITMVAPLLARSADPATREGLEMITDAAGRARELVREILAFSRKEATSVGTIRLDLLVAQAMTIIRAGIPVTIQIVADLQPVPEIVGSKGQIYQAVLNLMTNAAQAVGEAGGTITIAVDYRTMAPNDEGRVCLSVADNGAGMDDATRQRIFEPFFTNRVASGGTGLGLSIVRGVVQTHGGSISVQSTIGQGTRFDLLFPPSVQAEAT